MGTKHTKGEWELYETPDYHEPKCSTLEVGSKDNSAWICKVQNNGLISSEEGLANAKLIAAAPELLEALIEVKMELMNHIMSLKNESIFMKINNAIDKATE